MFNLNKFNLDNIELKKEYKFLAFTEDRIFVDSYLSPNGYAVNPSSGEEQYSWKLIEYLGINDRDDGELYSGCIIMYRNDAFGGWYDLPEPHNDFAIITYSKPHASWMVDARFKDNTDKYILPISIAIDDFLGDDFEIIGHIYDDQEGFLAGYIGEEFVDNKPIPTICDFDMFIK